MHDDRFNDLTLRANSVHKYTKSDKEEMLVHLKAQLDYIRRRRAEKGETGYIDFVDWD
jgi:hypothetical protein